MEHGHHHHQAGGTDSVDVAELLDLDASVLHAYWADVTSWVRRQSPGGPTRRILDLGAGTGTGTIALVQRFGGSEVIALDVSASMLARVRTKAFDLGLAGRVRTLEADLEGTWPVAEPVDLVWASMALHELADPDRLLNQACAGLRPGGLMVVAEMDAPLRFLPDDLGLGLPGLEARCLAALAEANHHARPFGSDWGKPLEVAGFTLVSTRTFAIDLPSLPSGATGRYAHGWFHRMRSALADRLDPEDLATLDTLIESHGPDGLLQRGDLVVRGSRTAWVARRP